jgi:DNA-binding CsgD family transcriptional regulator
MVRQAAYATQSTARIFPADRPRGLSGGYPAAGHAGPGRRLIRAGALPHNSARTRFPSVSLCTMAPRFIGRMPELTSITGLCSPSLEGSGTAAVLVGGPAGSGKTRLLREAEVRLAKWPCLRVAGYQAALTVPARGERPIERLSERQRQIARMVASGASNREIGAVLFLSPKTVERHVSNMYAQTGVRNRTELAALLGAESEP